MFSPGKTLGSILGRGCIGVSIFAILAEAGLWVLEEFFGINLV